MPTNVCKKCGYSSAEADYCPNDGTKMDKIGFGEKLWENLSDQQKQELLNAYYPGGNFSQAEESKHGKIKLPSSKSQSGVNVKKAALERAYAQAKAFDSEKGREEFAYRISYSIIAILLLLIGSLFGLVELALMGTTQNGADGFSVIILSVAVILFACGICLILLRLSDMLTAIVLSIPIAHAPAAPVRTGSASARTSSAQPSAKTAPAAPSSRSAMTHRQTGKPAMIKVKRTSRKSARMTIRRNRQTSALSQNKRMRQRSQLWMRSMRIFQRSR